MILFRIILPNINKEEVQVLKEFREFAMRGNVVDMAVGIIIGAAFGTIVKSLVSDVIMPPVDLLLGGVDFSNLFIVIKEGTTPGNYATLADAQAAGAVTVNYGTFIDTIISFVIVAAVIFVLIKNMNRLKSSQQEAALAEPTIKDCPYCFSSIPIKATRCPHCTSEIS